MPRQAKPYLKRDWYISRPGGEYLKLCHRSEGKTKANAILCEHLSRRQQEKTQNGGRALHSLTVKELFVMFREAPAGHDLNPEQATAPTLQAEDHQPRDLHPETGLQLGH